jgi:hypothetical protein
MITQDDVLALESLDRDGQGHASECKLEHILYINGKGIYRPTSTANAVANARNSMKGPSPASPFS